MFTVPLPASMRHSLLMLLSTELIYIKLLKSSLSRCGCCWPRILLSVTSTYTSKCLSFQELRNILLGPYFPSPRKPELSHSRLWDQCAVPVQMAFPLTYLIFLIYQISLYHLICKINYFKIIFFALLEFWQGKNNIRTGVK